MAIGRTNAGGGGMPLNFMVVPGLTQPVTASENTIWVKVEAIGDWYFSATQPENLQELDVWILVNEYSPVEFNALKKNGIQVCPTSAKQYVSGALSDVTTMIYQNGEWSKFISTLYVFENGLLQLEMLNFIKQANGVKRKLTKMETFTYTQ